MSEIAAPKRIIVLTKYRFIGDTLLAVPLLRALNSLWPDAELTLLTGAPACELLQNCPYIADTIEFDPYRKQDAGWKRFLQTVSRIRSGHYDLAMVCNRSFHSALLAYLGGAQARAGWSGFQGRDWMLTHTAPYGCDDPEQKSYLDLITPVFANHPVDASLELWVTPGERAMVRQYIPEHCSPLIAIQPGASHAEKQWQPEKFASLIESLHSQHPDARFVFIGGSAEREAAKSVIDLLSSNVSESTVNLVGALSLRQTLACLTYLQLFVGGDTAIRHCASALGVPSIALFGPTSVKKWGNINPPCSIAIQSASGVVADIPVSDVLAKASDALESVSDTRLMMAAQAVS